MSGYEQWQLNDLRKRIERLERVGCPSCEKAADVEDEPADITEEPPVGSQVTDCMGDVWERREGGWALWWPQRSGWTVDLYRVELDPWPVVRNLGFRPATDEDRKRVGLPVEPAPADVDRDVKVEGCTEPTPRALICTEREADGHREVRRLVLTTYQIEDEPSLLRGCDGADLTPDAVRWLERFVEATEDKHPAYAGVPEPAPADDGLPEWERELLRKADLADMIWQRDVAAKVKADRDEWREDAIRNDEDRNKWMARYDEMRRERNEWRAKHAALRADVEDALSMTAANSRTREEFETILDRDAAREPKGQ